MTNGKVRAALLVLLLLPVGSRAAARVPAVAGAQPKPAPAAGAGDPGSRAPVEDPLGEVPPDDPSMEAYSHGNYLLFLLDSLWSAALLSGS